MSCTTILVQGMIRYLAVGVAVLAGVALVYGARRWQSATEAIRTRLESARLSIEPKRYDAEELEGLPPPVQKYFRAVLKDGQPMVSAVSVEHTGTFNSSEEGERWSKFTSNQRVITQRPGFDWDARIAMMPGVTARVHDAYIQGEGILHASLFGLFSVVKLESTPELAHGEFMRFFAETAWYPTALLPSQGVRWEAVDHTSAQATLQDGGISVTLLFRFDAAGLIESVRSEARSRAVGNAVVPTPWEGRWSSYQLRDEMRVPTEGEVAWILPEGRKPYWRGRITKLEYEFATEAGKSANELKDQRP